MAAPQVRGRGGPGGMLRDDPGTSIARMRAHRNPGDGGAAGLVTSEELLAAVVGEGAG